MDRLTAMETFVCVVEAGSFSAAARRLNIGQPAVSKSIAQLEERLQVRLFTRSTRRLMMTEAGQLYFEGAKRTIDEANETDQVTRGAGSLFSGRIRVCAAVTFARLHVLPKLQTFLDKYPDLEVDVVLDDRSINLVEQGIDVALRMGSLTDSAMTARKISQSRRLLVGTPGYFAKYGEPISPLELVEHQFVVYTQGAGGHHWSFQRQGSEISVVVRGRVCVSAAEGVRAVVLADMGLTICSEWMFAPELANGTIRPALTDWSLPPIDLWAVFPTGRLACAKAKAFVDFVEAELKHELKSAASLIDNV